MIDILSLYSLLMQAYQLRIKHSQNHTSSALQADLDRLTKSLEEEIARADAGGVTITHGNSAADAAAAFIPPTRQSAGVPSVLDPTTKENFFEKMEEYRRVRRSLMAFCEADVTSESMTRSDILKSLLN